MCQGGAGVLDGDEVRGAWVRCGREGLSDGCVMVYRAVCGSVVIGGEGMDWEVGNGVVSSVGSGWWSGGSELSVSMTTRAGVVDVLMA